MNNFNKTHNQLPKQNSNRILNTNENVLAVNNVSNNSMSGNKRYSNSNLQDAFKPYSRESNNSMNDINSSSNVNVQMNARANMMK